MRKSTKKKERVSFVLDKEAIDIIELYAKGMNRPKGEIMRALINISLDEPRVLNSVGIYKVESLREKGIVQLPIGRYE